jgi:hypothetical protein
MFSLVGAIEERVRIPDGVGGRTIVLVVAMMWKRQMLSNYKWVLCYAMLMLSAIAERARALNPKQVLDSTCNSVANGKWIGQ